MRSFTTALVAMLLAAAAAGPADAFSQAVSAAQASGQQPHPDRPLWREAIMLGEQAREAQPDDPAVILQLAALYSEVDWHIRAYTAWLDYAELTGEAPDPEAFAEAAHQLGFARYSAGDIGGALGYYRNLAEWQPDNAEAGYWLGRLLLEQGEDLAAEEAFAQLLGMPAATDLPASQLRLARQVRDYGAAAGRSFSLGLGLYDQGDAVRALEQFEAAFTANRSFTEAAVWAGRTALELGQSELAAGYWAWAVELDPADERSRFFLSLARREAQWGSEATAEFDAGQAAYGEGNLEEALVRFEAAVSLSPDYADAVSWSARVAQELGRFGLAADYWRQVLRLDPDDEGARYFLNLAEQRIAFGPEVSEAFLRGVGHYQQADFAAAEAEFLLVTEESPEFAPAWGYLGQIYFSQGRYAPAAEAYETARSLEPGNEEYTFFAMEARRLSATSD